MNKKLIWIIVGTVVVGGGIGAYFYFKKKNKGNLKNEEIDGDGNNPTINTNDNTNDNTDDNSNNNPTNKRTDKSKDKSNDKSKDKSNDKPQKDEKQKDIDKIVKYQKSIGVTPKESQLNGKDKKFLSVWADAIDKKPKSRGFLYNNYIYSLSKGIKNIKNPKGKSVYSRFGVKYKGDVDDKVASVVSGTAGEMLGKIDGWKFDKSGNLYVYLPNRLGLQKWFEAKGLSTSYFTNTKLSFTGGEEEVWAGFDDNFDITFR